MPTQDPISNQNPVPAGVTVINLKEYNQDLAGTLLDLPVAEEAQVIPAAIIIRAEVATEVNDADIMDIVVSKSKPLSSKSESIPIAERVLGGAPNVIKINENGEVKINYKSQHQDRLLRNLKRSLYNTLPPATAVVAGQCFLAFKIAEGGLSFLLSAPSSNIIIEDLDRSSVKSIFNNTAKSVLGYELVKSAVAAVHHGVKLVQNSKTAATAKLQKLIGNEDPSFIDLINFQIQQASLKVTSDLNFEGKDKIRPDQYIKVGTPEKFFYVKLGVHRTSYKKRPLDTLNDTKIQDIVLRGVKTPDEFNKKLAKGYPDAIDATTVATDRDTNGLFFTDVECRNLIQGTFTQDFYSGARMSQHTGLYTEKFLPKLFRRRPKPSIIPLNTREHFKHAVTALGIKGASNTRNSTTHLPVQPQAPVQNRRARNV